jgi:alkylated DNA repair protein (DNA oxidative demethylase)
MRSDPQRPPRANDLFADAPRASRAEIADGAFVLFGAALGRADAIVAAIRRIEKRSPFRNMKTPGGLEMSVAMTSCGDYGWVTDRSGYRYSPVDPLTDKPWPAMPEVLRECAGETAASAGFPGFVPDSCLINRYLPGTKLSLHQDKDEADFSWPVVSVSLGLPATFVFGGLRRVDKTLSIPLQHGDVVVWGGPARLRYHGVLPVKDGEHPLLGRQRINLTLRRAK